MHPVVLEYEYAVNRWTIKTQLYKIMIHSATSFDPMMSPSGWSLELIKAVYTSYYGREISLLTNYVTVQFLEHSVQDLWSWTHCKNNYMFMHHVILLKKFQMLHSPTQHSLKHWFPTCGPKIPRGSRVTPRELQIYLKGSMNSQNLAAHLAIPASAWVTVIISIIKCQSI